MEVNGLSLYVLNATTVIVTPFITVIILAITYIYVQEAYYSNYIYIYIFKHMNIISPVHMVSYFRVASARVCISYLVQDCCATINCSSRTGRLLEP